MREFSLVGRTNMLKTWDLARDLVVPTEPRVAQAQSKGGGTLIRAVGSATT